MGTALPASVFFEEAARFAAGTHHGSAWNVAIDLVLGILVVVLIGRTNRQRALALAVALPLAAMMFIGFAVAGTAV